MPAQEPLSTPPARVKTAHTDRLYGHAEALLYGLVGKLDRQELRLLCFLADQDGTLGLEDEESYWQHTTDVLHDLAMDAPDLLRWLATEAVAA